MLVSGLNMGKIQSKTITSDIKLSISQVISHLFGKINIPRTTL